MLPGSQRGAAATASHRGAVLGGAAEQRQETRRASHKALVLQDELEECAEELEERQDTTVDITTGEAKGRRRGTVVLSRLVTRLAAFGPR